MPGFAPSRFVGVSEEELDQWTCSICYRIFEEPVFTPCCRQTFCKSCMDSWLTSRRKICPIDRSELRADQLMVVPRFVTNIFNIKQIKCQYEDLGCPVVTTIGKLESHEGRCDYNTSRICRSCGVIQVIDKKHNCLTNLVIKNKGFYDELNELRDDYRKLKQTIDLGITILVTTFIAGMLVFSSTTS